MAVYKVRSSGNEYEVKVTDHAGGGATVTVEGQSFEVESVGPAVSTPAVAAQGKPTPAAPPAAGAAPPPAAANPTPAPQTGGSGSITAPIPGVVTNVLVKTGDKVVVGQVILKLEAMKMENDIATPAAGTVKAVHVSQGSEVNNGQLLVEID